MKLNREEMVWGACFGISFFGVVGWLAIPQAIACAYLWALSGTGASKLYRRLGCPLTVALTAYIVSKDIWVFVSLPLAFGILSIGYGIPDAIPPYDEGSTLGKFWYKISPKYAHFLTRSTIVILLILAYIPTWRHI